MTTQVEQDGIRDRRTYLIIGAAMAVHRNLGFGFLEAVYQRALELELRERGVSYEREKDIPVYYRGARLGIGYRADFLCDGEILVEVKGIPRLTRADESQVLNYLFASKVSRAILLNFGGPSLQVKRFVGRNFVPETTDGSLSPAPGAEQSRQVATETADQDYRNT